MEITDNQANPFDGPGPGGRVVACTKKPALRLACSVDQTPKLSNLLDDIEKIEGLSQYIENQGDENLRFVKGKLIKVEFPSSFKGIVFVANYYTLSKNGFQNEL